MQQGTGHAQPVLHAFGVLGHQHSAWGVWVSPL
jgi:hypothetical protein